jgi:hypothetical protein
MQDKIKNTKEKIMYKTWYWRRVLDGCLNCHMIKKHTGWGYLMDKV